MFKEIGQGMAFTLKKMFQPSITMKWPEEQKPTPPRHRGRHILHRYDNGLEKCIGCELCSGACPVGCIYVVPAENDPEHPVSPGERYAARYEINLMRCIYCGYCAEACPTEAITLGPRFEMADYRREHTVVTKEELLESWPGMASERRKSSPAGAGADQQGREQLEQGPDAAPAWDRFAHEHAQRDELLPGHGGLAVHPPSVMMPRDIHPLPEVVVDRDVDQDTVEDGEQ